MNEFSDNKYYAEAVSGDNDIEFAIERKVPRDEVELIASCVVVLHGFSVHLQGTRYLIELFIEYLYSDGFCLDKCISAVAKKENVEFDYVVNCILSSIENNLSFIPIASRLLEQKISYPEPLIYGILEIMGAVFKIYYNCVIENDKLSEEKEQ